MVFFLFFSFSSSSSLSRPLCLPAHDIARHGPPLACVCVCVFTLVCVCALRKSPSFVPALEKRRFAGCEMRFLPLRQTQRDDYGAPAYAYEYPGISETPCVVVAKGRAIRSCIQSNNDTAIKKGRAISDMTEISHHDTSLPYTTHITISKLANELSAKR